MRSCFPGFSTLPVLSSTFSSGAFRRAPAALRCAASLSQNQHHNGKQHRNRGGDDIAGGLPVFGPEQRKSSSDDGATIPPPTLCEMFQNAPTRPRSRRGNQLAMVINEGPTPMPRNSPLITTSATKIQNALLKPSPTFTAAHHHQPAGHKDFRAGLIHRAAHHPLLIP